VQFKRRRQKRAVQRHKFKNESYNLSLSEVSRK